MGEMIILSKFFELLISTGLVSDSSMLDTLGLLLRDEHPSNSLCSFGALKAIEFIFMNLIFLEELFMFSMMLFTGDFDRL